MSKDGKKPLGDSSVFQKGRKGAMRVIYGRTAIIAVSFLAQIILIGGVVNFFRPYIPMFFGGYMVLGLGIVLLILNKETTPETKLMWTVITMLLPLVGAALYVYVETQPGYRLLAKRLNDIYKQTEAFVQQDEAVLDALEQKDIGTAQLARYVHKNGNFATYQNTEVTFFPLGEDKFAAMLTELEQAEQFIFMEYFILKEGYMWEKILEILERKVQAGVEVRVMYDGTCAMFDLPYRDPEELQAKGIQCKMFAPIRPILSTHYNNRDHRKILVIDGKVGFTGGVNIGDEYINRVEKHGHWKDTAVMLKGDAVQGLTMMFLQMWNVTEKEPEYGKYLQKAEKGSQAKGFVLPYGDSPFDDEPVGETVFSKAAAVWVLCAFDLAVLYLVSTLSQVCLGGGIEGIFSSFFACVLDLIPMAVLILFFALINQLVKGSSLTVLLCVVCYVALVVFGTYMPSVGGLVFTGYLRWHNLWIGVTLPFLSLLPRIGLLAGYGLVFGCGGYLLFDRKEA